MFLCAAALAAALPLSARSGPFDGKQFRGRIAYSADGNYSDEDDWASSPVALALMAEFGVKDRLVHFHYNNILPDTNPAWEKQHDTSVRGAIERFGYNPAIFYDCRRQFDAAVNSIAKVINESSADNPLYFVLAGPMEVPFLGIHPANTNKPLMGLWGGMRPERKKNAKISLRTTQTKQLIRR